MTQEVIKTIKKCISRDIKLDFKKLKNDETIDISLVDAVSIIGHAAAFGLQMNNSTNIVAFTTWFDQEGPEYNNGFAIQFDNDARTCSMWVWTRSKP